MHCQNCGQNNTNHSNFCRFCGTKFSLPQYANGFNYQPLNLKQTNYENSPHRPYSWKTDEYPINDARSSGKTQTGRAQSLTEFQFRLPVSGSAAIQPLHQQPHALSTNYHCPRCSSQLFPRLVRQISTGGWIVFAILLVAFFPLFWVGLLIKEETRVCPVCNFKYD